MNLRGTLSTLRTAWAIPVAATVLAGLAALGVTLLITPQYTATTQLFVSANATSSSSEDVLRGTELSRQRVSSYTQLLNGEELAKRLIERLDLRVSPKALLEGIEAVALPDSVLIDVSVTDPSPEQAQAIAEAIDKVFPRMAARLESAGSRSLVAVSVVSPPTVPTEPSSPDLPLNVALACFAGLAIGIGAVLLREHLDRSVKDQKVAEEVTGAPVIGTVLRNQGIGKQHLIGEGTDEAIGEDYRQIRTNLQFLNVDSPPRTIMVSSSLPAEGKTTLVINLARVLADAKHSVMVVEADLRRPKLTEYLGLVDAVGLTNVLAGSAEVADVTQHYAEGRVAVLAAGAAAPNPGELLASTAMAGLLAQLREQYDYVLVDASPLLPVADASGLAPMVDGVLLVAHYGSTSTDQLGQAATTLRRVGASILGVVLSMVSPKAETAEGRSQGYGYDAVDAQQK